MDNKFKKLAEQNQTEFKFFLEKVFPHTMKWEGGSKLHNVEGDAGGWTKYGVAWNYNKQYFDNFDDFKNMTEEQAAIFAFHNYYHPLNPAYLKSNLKLLLFDISYNMGTSRAIKYIQECSGVVADGIIGKNTRSVMNKITVDCVQNKRLAFYNSKKTSKFYKGWMNRANDIYNITLKN